MAASLLKFGMGSLWNEDGDEDEDEDEDGRDGDGVGPRIC